MMFDFLPEILHWKADDAPAVISFMVAGALFAAFHFLTLPSRLEAAFNARGYDEQTSILYAGVARKGIGGLMLGLGSVITLMLMQRNPLDFGVASISFEHTAYVVVLSLLVMALPVWLSMQKPDMWAHYPEIRTTYLPPKRMALSVLSWCAYLIGFEFFFRGFLLFLWTDLYGAWPALAMTTALYVLVHLPTNATETTSTVPMGIVFGVMSLYCGGFVAPLLVHIVVAAISDVAAARANPAIKTT